MCSPINLYNINYALDMVLKHEVLTMTKDTDPNNIDQHSGGAKLDAGKPDMSLLLMFGKALYETMRVGTGGKIKYSRGGWQEVPDGINRYTAAMLRHVFEEHYEEFDPDLVEYLGEPTYHAAAVAWNALARLELMLREKLPKVTPQTVLYTTSFAELKQRILNMAIAKGNEDGHETDPKC